MTIGDQEFRDRIFSKLEGFDYLGPSSFKNLDVDINIFSNVIISHFKKLISEDKHVFIDLNTNTSLNRKLLIDLVKKQYSIIIIVDSLFKICKMDAPSYDEGFSDIIFKGPYA